MRQTRRARHGTDREIDAEEQPPVAGAAEHGTGHEREHEPVGEVEHALHAIVSGPQASRGTDAERSRDTGYEQPDGERERRPRPGRTAPAVEEQERDPDGRRDLDDRAGVDGLADDERREDVRRDDEGGGQDEDDAGPNDPRQYETVLRRGGRSRIPARPPAPPASHAGCDGRPAHGKPSPTRIRPRRRAPALLRRRTGSVARATRSGRGAGPAPSRGSGRRGD